MEEKKHCSCEEHEHQHHEHHHHHDHGCGCHHHHEHHHEEGGVKQKLVLIITTVVLLIGAVLIEKNCNLEVWQLLLVYLVPYLLIGHDTLKEAVEGIVSGDIFNENFLTRKYNCLTAFDGSQRRL